MLGREQKFSLAREMYTEGPIRRAKKMLAYLNYVFSPSHSFARGNSYLSVTGAVAGKWIIYDALYSAALFSTTLFQAALL